MDADTPTPPARKPRRVAMPRLSPALKGVAEIAYFPAGAMLVRQGESTTRLFLVASGSVRVVLGTGADARIVARLGAGAWIGETALLTGSVSSTTVIADDDVRVFAITQHDFLAAAEQDPAIFREVARALAERLRSAHAIIDTGPAHRVIALRHERAHEPHAREIDAGCALWSPQPHITVALGDETSEHASVADYARDASLLAALRAELGEHNGVTVPAGGADANDMAAFLRAVAEFSGLVVLRGDRAHDVPRQHVTEFASLGRARKVSQKEDGHHWIVIDERFDAQRVARWMVRRRIGLALGGGGARGFAHIGALRAIAKTGVPIDVVTGTSIGGAVAAGIASGRSVETIADAIGAAGRGAMMPALPPVHSVFSTMWVEREVRRQFGESTFEELTLPLGVVAVDLLTGEEIVFTSGRLVPAVMASMAVPGMFPPVRYEGRLLADGALRSPVPVRACRALGGDIVIASHMRVQPPALRSARPRMPWMPETMVWALDIMQDNVADESAGGADIRIETVIPRDQGGLFDFGHRYGLEAAGEAAATAALTGVTPESLRTAARRHGRRAGEARRASGGKQVA